MREHEKSEFLDLLYEAAYEPAAWIPAGLTDAEVSVAQTIFEGATLQDIAARFGIRDNTVRVQIASIFDKTQTNRQVDLAAMLSRLSHMRAS